MSDFDKQKVETWITQYWKGPRTCQVCGSDDWLILDNIWELRKFEKGALVVGSGPLLPVVAVMCNVCGQLVFFNAIAVKAVERGKPESS